MPGAIGVEWSFPMLAILGLSILLAGFILGYGVRSGISHRRRAEARRRYETSGSFSR
jgi:hypothetical protein